METCDNGLSNNAICKISIAEKGKLVMDIAEPVIEKVASGT